MKTLRLISIALVMACGAPVDEPDGESIGTLEQAVYMPYRYGIEGVTDWQGHPDFGRECQGSLPSEVADNWCSVPNSKTIKLTWNPSSCPTSGGYGVSDGFRGVVYEAIVHWTNEMTLAGWTVIGSDPDFTLKCEGVPGSAMGRFQPGPDWDQIGASYGTLGQYKTGKVQIDSADIISFAYSLASGSAAARYEIVSNLVMHELWHLSGFGHSAHGAGPDIMNEAPDGTWVQQKLLGSTRWHKLECYNPANGGLFDDC